MSDITLKIDYFTKQRGDQIISIDTAREFFWLCTVINIGILLIATIFIAFANGTVLNIYSKLFKLSDADLSRSYF